MLLVINICAQLLSTAGAQTPDNVYTAAKKSLGKQMWKGYGLPNGKLGCAASLSNVLKLGGVNGVHSASVAVMRNQLLSRKHKEIILRNGGAPSIDNAKLKQLARPGDVVVAFMRPPDRDNSGPNAHCGIMADEQEIMTNDWNDGIWKQLNIHLMFDYYPYIRLIRIQNANANAR